NAPHEVGRNVAAGPCIGPPRGDPRDPRPPRRPFVATSLCEGMGRICARPGGGWISILKFGLGDWGCWGIRDERVSVGHRRRSLRPPLWRSHGGGGTRQRDGGGAPRAGVSSIPTLIASGTPSVGFAATFPTRAWGRTRLPASGPHRLSPC